MRPVVTVVGEAQSHRTHVSMAFKLLNVTMFWISGSRNKYLYCGINQSILTGGIIIPVNEKAKYKVMKSLSCHESIMDASPPLSIFKHFESEKTGKFLTMNWLHNNDLGHYAIRGYTNISHIMRFPVMVKKPVSSAGRNILIVNTMKFLKRVTRNANLSKNLIVQDAIKNTTEWGVHFAAFSSVVHARFCAKIVFKDMLFVRNRKPKGFKQLQWLPCPVSLVRMLENIVMRGKYHGFGCIGAKFVESNPKLIELNTRLCGMAIRNTQI